MDPGTTERFYHFYRQGRLAEAEQLINDQLANHPDSAPLLTMRSMIENENGDHLAACETARSALAIEPESQLALRSLAFAYSDLSHHDYARQAADTLVRLYPHDGDAFCTRAVVGFQRVINDRNENRKKNKKAQAPIIAQAMADIDKAIELDPSDAHHHYCKARIALIADTRALSRRGHREAQAAAQTALSINPHHEGAHLLLSQLHTESRDDHVALNHARSGLSNNPQSESLQRQLGMNLPTRLHALVAAFSLPAAMIVIAPWVTRRPPGAVLSAVTAIGLVIAIVFALRWWRRLPTSEKTLLTRGPGRNQTVATVVMCVVLVAVSLGHMLFYPLGALFPVGVRKSPNLGIAGPLVVLVMNSGLIAIPLWWRIGVNRLRATRSRRT